ncbi:hypothetical protein GN244_ATG04389 [Phytophthora infestans]|uniref:Secreted RxLR effector peptide protein n=1 Tax=Phytophthora infestans TaxID=4787 RepID=A0A833S9F4_PHYIN|nr:hypothetical protein GN244_ATG04389 [Phytophthora infestans]KAF4149514.1 hypothetical protein GN958_ATG01329 [Phytophthora infestans]
MKGASKKVAVTMAVIFAVAAVCASDKRRWPSKPTRRFSMRTKVWLRVLRKPAFAENDLAQPGRWLE